MFERWVLERRTSVATYWQISAFVAALALSALLATGVLILAGVPLANLPNELIVQVFFAQTGLAQTITVATIMMLVGLAATLCLKLGFWNIGIEGQLLIGGIAATAVALYDVGGSLRLPLMLTASALGGAFWIAIPLFLKQRWQVSEVIVSLLLTNIAFLLLQHLLFGAFGDPARNFPTSAPFEASERLARIGLGNVHSGLYIALVLVFLVALLLRRTRFGFALRLVADNPEAARALGFEAARIGAIVVLLGGAIAGLAGGIVVTGTEYLLSQYIGLHATFNGIVVAALARYSPAWVPVAAFFLAGLSVAAASLKVFYGVSEGVVLIIQGVILLTLVSCQFFTTYKVRLNHVRDR